uniref:Leucine rich repeat containing 27 n=1 Tax=Sphenodon punctatus TaxID=8508 RepID=A0A8D0GIT9_SPHPU
MEEKHPSIESHGSCDNLETEQYKTRNLSDPSSAHFVRKAVEDILCTPLKALDLSRKNLQYLSEEIYKFHNLKHLHLEGNALSIIPKDFFQKLPNLVWLDLRYNKIKALPSGIGYHKQLKTLLLEKNPIKRLPVELGYLSSLTALNLRHCPLEFPPHDVVQKGLPSILYFLRTSDNENDVDLEPSAQGRYTCCPLPGGQQSGGSRHGGETGQDPCGAGAPYMPPVEKLNLTDLVRSSLDLSDEWPNGEEILRFQKLREEIIKDEQEEFLANKDLSRPTHCTKSTFNFKSSLKNIFPEISSYDLMIQAKRSEEFRLAALKEMKEKQALIEQRRKQVFIILLAISVAFLLLCFITLSFPLLTNDLSAICKKKKALIWRETVDY